MPVIEIDLDSETATSGPIQFTTPSPETLEILKELEQLNNNNREPGDYPTVADTVIRADTFSTFEKTMTYIKNFFLVNMLTILNANVYDGRYCNQYNTEGSSFLAGKQGVVTMQSSSITFAPNAEINNCRFIINISTDVETGALCYNINDRLNNMTQQEKQNIINQVITNLYTTSGFRTAMQNKQRFLNLLRENLKTNLVTLSGSGISSTCSQETLVQKTQDLTIGGKINCFNSTFRLDNTLVLRAFLACLVVPSFDRIERDAILRRYFNEGDNVDCYFFKQILEPCSETRTTKKVRVTLLQNIIGNGSCPYNFGNNNSTVVEEECYRPECKLSPWSNWSDCKLSDPTTSIIGTKSRVRSFVGSGVGCNEYKTKETIECTDFRNSINAQDIENLTTDGSIFNLFLKGTIQNSKQIIIVICFITLLVGFFIMYKI